MTDGRMLAVMTWFCLTLFFGGLLGVVFGVWKPIPAYCAVWGFGLLLVLYEHPMK